MKIMIVGAGGQLARCLLRPLEAHQLVPLDRQALDITRLDDVRAAVATHRPDLVINCSAYNQVDLAETQIDAAFAINARGPRNLAVATADKRLPLVHVSTDYVFNGVLTRPYHEFDRTDPRSTYGASKLAGEEAVRALNHRHYIVRTAWLFWEHGQSFLAGIRARANDPALQVANDQFGSPTYVPHLADGIARLVDTEAFGTYHMTGRGGTSRWELVGEFFRAIGISARPRPVSRLSFKAAAERPAYSVLTTLQDPRIELPPWQDGVAEFARHLR